MKFLVTGHDPRHKVNYMTEWEKQSNGTFWPSKETKVGEQIEGKCVSIDNGKYGLNYSIELADKSLVITKAGKALLPRMTKVQVGTMVKIVFLGEEPPKIRGQNPMQTFDVFIAKTPTPSGTAPTTPTQAPAPQ